MVDTPRPSKLVLPVVCGLIVVGLVIVGGILLEAAVRADTFTKPANSVDADALAAKNLQLTRDLATAQAEIERLKTDARQRTPIPIDPAGESGQTPNTAPIRDALTLREEIAAALGAGSGQELLELLGELAALGDTNLPGVAGHWVALANMNAAALDRLGLSKIDLASALVQSTSLMKFALDQADLDPTFRQFTARTLEQASTKLRRSILDDLDFSTEKDKAVLHPIVRATQGFQDESYVDRFSHLVQRTDLYNDSRSSIAFRIAAIGGDKGRQAIDRMRLDSNGKGLFKRMLPVLESIYAPPATGLLVTNGMRPGDARIGHNDLILEYGGQRIRTRADLTRADGKTKLGQVVSVKILRDGVEHILRITVTDTAPGHLHFSSRAIVRR